MNLFSKRSSLSSDFALFSFVILGAVAILAVWFWAQVYQDELRRRKEQLPAETTRIDAVLTDYIDYTAKYMEFMGERIIRHDTNDLTFIADLMGGRYRTRPQEPTLYVTTVFDWVTPDKQLRVSSKIGKLAKPLDMSDREFVQRAHHLPWTLQLGSPRVGRLSQQWLIPGGMGLTDAKGTFVGTITMGFSLEALSRRMAQAIGQTDMRYLILTDNFKPVIDSTSDNTSPDGLTPFDASLWQPNYDKNSGYLDKVLTLNGTNYSYYKRLAKYPFIILAGYSTSLGDSLYTQVVLSRILGFTGIGVVALFILYLMRRRLVRPVMELAAQAHRISRGENVHIRESYIEEIDTLGKQLQKISDYIQNERRISEELTHKTHLLEHKTKELETAHAVALVARDQAIKADQAKSEFLANMSHEIRTPMNAVVGLTEIMLMKQHSPERQKEYLRTMQISAQQLMQLINDLLDVAKLETRQVQLERIPFQLQSLLNETIAVHGIAAREKGITLTLHADAPPPPLVLGDPLRLRQILMNLIGNAVKFTEQGGVVVKYRHESLPEDGILLRISVTDTGIGIPSDKLDSVFSKFSQADTSITRKYGGTGLGLSICKSLIELMKGRISVESIHGKGSCFTIELPLPIHHQTAPIRAENTPQPIPENAPDKDFRILLVEDNSGNILVATSLLDNYGYRYDIAQTGKEALEKLHEGDFTLVLMDVQMPEMDGLEVTRSLRNLEQNGKKRHIIIGMTAHANASDRERCLQAGMDDFISKPFNPDDFIRRLRQYSETPPHPSKQSAA